MFPPAPAASTATDIMLGTLVMSDLVNSTGLFHELGEQRANDLLTEHERRARDLLRDHRGREIDKSDGFLLLFDRPLDAVRFSVAYHRALRQLGEEAGVKLEARVGINLGEVVLRRNSEADVERGAKPLEIDGLAKPVTARVMSLALGRQTLLTRATFDLARRAATPEALGGQDLRWLDYGSFEFQGLAEPEEICEVGEVGIAPLHAPPDSEKARRSLRGGEERTLGWRPAARQELPRHPHWVLERRLGEGAFGEVWLALHRRTGEHRVFKFCYDADKVRALEREVTLFRLLKEALGNREDIARILDWNFDEAPYYIESEYSEGGDLEEWAENEGGMANVPLETRLELVAQVADALGAAHSVAVLHKDIKPANVLVHDSGSGLKVKLTDFGIGLLTDRRAASIQGVDTTGMTELLATATSATTGTRMYLAPELLEGKIPTLQADLYALGVLLYQMAAGDLRRALGPGWRRDIDDELLREDIARLVDRSPERRPASASEVAQALRSLPERREAMAADRRRQKRRAASRRRRRVLGAVGAFTLLFAIVVSFLAAQAIRARREADRRRAQADELIRFMVDDLRERLEPLGRLDILDDVGDQAMAYFEGLPPGDLTDEDLARYAEALQQIGEVRAKQGDLAAALASFEQARLLAEELAARAPDSPRALLGLGTSRFWIGSVYWDRHEYDAALTEFRAYEAAVHALSELDPQREDWKLERAYAHSNIGSVLEAQGDLEGAFEEFRASLAIREQLLAKNPFSSPRKLDLARAYNKVAHALEGAGRLNEAAELYERELELMQALASEKPDHADWKRSLGIVQGALGNVYQVLGRTADARHWCEQALATAEELTQLDPTNASWQRDLAIAHRALGRLDRKSGRTAGARRHAEADIEIMQQLVALAPDETKLRIDLGLGYLAKSKALDAGRRSVGYAEQARSLFEELLADDPNNPRRHLYLGQALVTLGDHWQSLGDPVAARASWEEAEVHLRAATQESQRPNERALWALLLARLDRLEEARPVVSELVADGYRDPDLVNLAMQMSLWSNEGEDVSSGSTSR